MTQIVNRTPLPDITLPGGEVRHLQLDGIETLQLTFRVTLNDAQSLKVGPLSLAVASGQVFWTTSAGRATLKPLEPVMLPGNVGFAAASVLSDVTLTEVTYEPSGTGTGTLRYTPTTLRPDIRAVTFHVGPDSYAATRNDTWGWEAPIPEATGPLSLHLEVLEGDSMFTTGTIVVGQVDAPVLPVAPPTIVYLADRPVVTPLDPGREVLVTFDLPVTDAFGSIVVDTRELLGELTLHCAALNINTFTPTITHL